MEHEVPAKLRAAMHVGGHDALVALSVDNVTYTAGFTVPSHVSNRFRRTVTVIAGDSFGCQIVVSVEENLARMRSRFADVRAYDQFTEDAADVLADALIEAGAGEGRIAIELDYMPAHDYLRLAERLPRARFEHARDLYFRARMIKTADELAVLRRVGELTEEVMGTILGELRPGLGERDAARRITDLIMDGGCQGVKVQVGSGERSGIVNCTPSERAMEAGDVVRVEILGDMDGYRSNVTRTAVLGPPTDEQKRIWSILIRARDACKAILGPGTPVAELYRTYVDACRSEGIEPTLRFLGHGIGQTIHEEPYITESRDIVLEPHITHTMEPLYMLPGRMGFHVEDMYVITDDGFDAITGDKVPNDELIACHP